MKRNVKVYRDWLQELERLRKAAGFSSQVELAESVPMSVGVYQAAETKWLATEQGLTDITRAFAKKRRSAIQAQADAANEWFALRTLHKDDDVPEELNRPRVTKLDASVDSPAIDLAAAASDHPVLGSIAAEVHTLLNEMRYALNKDHWVPLKSSKAWTHATNLLQEIEPRHNYMELMSLIPPSKWRKGQRETKWSSYQAQIVDRSWAASPDAVRRLHILDGKTLNMTLNKSRGLSENARDLCGNGYTFEERELMTRELRALLIAEYISGIRARVLFLCADDDYNNNSWPRHMDSWLVDAGTYYQTGNGYKVILSNLIPLQESYPESDLVVYKFHHTVGTERLYWLLRANYYRLLRSGSELLYTIFDLFDEDVSFWDQLEWEDVCSFIPDSLVARLSVGFKDLVVDKWQMAKTEGLAKEYEFESHLKDVLRPLRPSK